MYICTIELQTSRHPYDAVKEPDMEENRMIEPVQDGRPGQEAGLKKTMYALAAVAAVLLVALAAVWIERSSLVKELQIEKEDLTAEMIALQNDYASLSSDYESINM